MIAWGDEWDELARAAAARDPFGRAMVVAPRRVAIALTAVLHLGLVALVVDGAGLHYFAIGLGLGVATCIPIGIANVLVVDAALRFGVRRAIGASLGGAIADGVYSSFGVFGIGTLITRYAFLPPVLHGVSAIVLLVYSVVLVRTRPVVLPCDEPPAAAPGDGQLRRGFVIGLGATLLNPSAIVTWVVLVGSHASGITRGDGAAWVSGVVLGTLGWFLVLTIVARRGRARLRTNTVWMTRLVAIAVFASGVYSLGRFLSIVWR